MYDMTKDLERIDAVIAKGPYSDTWESLVNYRVPAWYRKAKFGIFIHWGAFTVPAFDNEWYSRNMYIEGSRAFNHHVETFGPQKDFGYKDFIPMFRMENFDPDKWAETFKESGAQYVIPVAEHHDGFQMYKTAISEWNAAEKGPKRDVYGDLVNACRKAGMESGASSHRIEHLWFMSPGRKFESDIKDPMQRGDFYWPALPDGAEFHNVTEAPFAPQEYLDDWLVRTCELIDSYRPSVLYFDWWIQHTQAKKHLRKIMAYYYNRAAEWGTEVVMNYKHEACAFGSAVPDMERGGFAETKPYYWQTDTSVARNSWCYTTENVYKDVPELIQNLADTVSKNGNLLLNVCPKADGTFDEENLRLMKGIGSWLKVNGEAIYDAIPWRTYGEGETRAKEGQFTDAAALPYTSKDFRFTAKGEYVYAIAMKPAEDGEYVIDTFGLSSDAVKRVYQGVVERVDVLGIEENASFEQTMDGLKVHTKVAGDQNPVTFRIRTK